MIDTIKIPCSVLQRTVCISLFVCLPQLVYAQKSNTVKEDEIIEEIVVTGSLIKKPSIFEGRAPVQSLDATVLSASGVTQLSDSLKNLTVNSGSMLASEQSEAMGTSQFSLRGLGLGSSLTLINGRRAGLAPVTNGAGNFFFDINSLPVTMIERIDVLTDGASATYGSEAVAGVANIITRSKFEGFEITAGASEASNKSSNVGFALGAASDKGHFSAFGAFYKQDENFRTDFDWIVDRLYDPNGDGNPIEGVLDSGTGSPGSYTRAVPSTTPGVFTNMPGAPSFADADCVAAGGLLSGGTCRMIFADQRTIIPAEKRIQIFTEATYAFNDQVEFFAEFGFSNNKVTDKVGAFTFDKGNLESGEGFYIPGSHPFNFWTDPLANGNLVYIDPASWNPVLHTAVDLAAVARPLGNEVNGRPRNGSPGAADLEREFRNTRVLLGLDLTLTPSWDASASWMHANNRFTELEPHNYIIDEFTRLVTAGEWNPFGTRLTNSSLVSPKDGVSIAGNTADVQESFDGVGVQTRETEMSVIEFIANGEISETIPLAVGFQHRDLSYDRVPDSLEAAGEGNRGARELRISGSQDVNAIFAETQFTFGKVAEVQIAGRYEDYGKVNTTDPKISAKIQANDWLAFRGSWGTSFQAPTLTQVAGEQTFGTLTDPRTSNAATGVCLAAGAPGGQNNNAIQKKQGSDTLKPQSAENYNLGLLFDPTDNIRISVDLWNYLYEDLITPDKSAQQLLNETCVGRAGLPPLDTGRVIRNASGQPVQTLAQFINVGEVEAAGFDFNSRYNLDTASIGQFALNLKATLLTKFDIDTGGNGISEDRKGWRNSDRAEAFAPQPELRWVFSTAWYQGGHSINFALRFIDSFIQDENTAPSLANPVRPEIESWTTMDIQYAYTLTSSGNSETSWMLGANNLSDEDPPVLSVFPTSSGLRPGFEGEVHDVRGRQVYLKLKHVF